MPFIEIKNLYKKYPNADNFALENLSLNIENNEIHGLLGPNGAGKTTLISILSGLILPTSGHCYIHNFSLKNQKKEIQKILGIVPQEYALYPTLTIEENLFFFGSMYGLKHAFLKKQIPLTLEKLGLLEFKNKKIMQCSGGMKRRCNLIAGVLHQPKILFLDEPTVGVDIHSKNLVISFLKEINTNGTCILYTSHHLKEAEDFCSHISIINEGKIIISDTPKNLIAQVPNVKNLEDAVLQLTQKS